LPPQGGEQKKRQHFPLFARSPLDSCPDKVPSSKLAMLGSTNSSPDSNGISMLEVLLFIAEASEMPLAAKTKRINEESRRCPIVEEVSLLLLVERLLLN